MSKGLGSAWKRRSPPSKRLVSRVSAPTILWIPRDAGGSIKAIKVVFKARRAIPVLSKAKSSTLNLVDTLGTPWSTRPRLRSCSASARYSDQRANTEGVGRLRNSSPSILSQGSVLIESPR